MEFIELSFVQPHILSLNYMYYFTSYRTENTVRFNQGLIN